MNGACFPLCPVIIHHPLTVVCRRFLRTALNDPKTHHGLPHAFENPVVLLLDHLKGQKSSTGAVCQRIVLEACTRALLFVAMFLCIFTLLFSTQPV
jgi:hypothetical protein